MTGESEAIAVGRRPQPGGRPPAPGRLAVVQAFLNSHYDLENEPGAELLRSPPALVAWLRRAGVLTGSGEADEHDLRRALVVRHGLRALAQGDVERARLLDVAAHGTGVEVRLAADGELHFVAAPVAGVAGALGVLLAIATVAVADGSWSRMKICPGDHCGWAFYDGSRNRSGRWCSMSVCGGRAKARSHYHRRRSAEA
jgi:CGNR zinc finger protein/putative stress-induced transcription regulator